MKAKKKLTKRKPTLGFLFDTETTGLVQNRSVKLAKQPEVIQFYGCIADLDTGEIVEEHGTFIKPRIPLSDEPPPGSRKTITQITGITNDMLAGAPSFSGAADPIFKIIEAGKKCIAHNLSFDKDMIEIEAERIGRTVTWPSEMVCTVEQTIHILGYRLSLSNLHLHLFGEAFKGAHLADVDVKALLRCVVELRKRGEML